MGSCLGSLTLIKSASPLQFNLCIVFPIKFAVEFSLQIDKVIPKCIRNNNLEQPRQFRRRKKRKRKGTSLYQMSIITIKLK